MLFASKLESTHSSSSTELTELLSSISMSSGDDFLEDYKNKILVRKKSKKEME